MGPNIVAWANVQGNLGCRFGVLNEVVEEDINQDGTDSREQLKEKLINVSRPPHGIVFKSVKKNVGGVKRKDNQPNGSSRKV